MLIFTLLYSNFPLQKNGTFDAILNDKLIGQHTFIYEDDKTLSHANFEFEYFFMDFIYQHKSTETWDGNCLKSISSNTDDDGDIYDVDGRLRFRSICSFIELTITPKASVMCYDLLPMETLKFLEQKKLMNAQSGEYLDVDIQFLSQRRLIWSKG